MNTVRKVLRIAIVTLLVLAVAIPVGVYVVVSTPWAQDKIRSVAERELTTLLGNEVSIGNVVYHPFNTVVINGVRVNDDNGKPALTAARIAARFELLTFLNTGAFEFDYAVIDVPEVSIYRADPQAPLNIAGIIEHLKPKDPNKEPSNFNLKIGTVVVRNGRFHYDVLSEPDSTGKFNPAHIHVSGLGLHAYIRQGSRERWDVDLETMSLCEHSGLILKDLQAKVIATPQHISLRNFVLELPASRIALKPIEVDINDFGTSSDIISSRNIAIEPLEPMTISTSDLLWAVPAFKNIERVITADFAVTVSHNGMNINRLNISDDKDSRFEMMGSINRGDSISGPEFNILRLRLDATAAEAMALTRAFNIKQTKALRYIGDIAVVGTAKGDMKGATFDMTAINRGARIVVNGKVTTPDRYRSIAFDSRGSIRGLNLAALTGSSNLGTMTATLTAKGSVAPYKTAITGNMDINQLQALGYTYTGIAVSCAYDSNEGEVTASINSCDLNASFDIEASAYVANPYKVVDIVADLHAIKPRALNLGGMEGHTLSGHLSVNGGGSYLDDISGTVSLTDARYSDHKSHTLDLKEFTIDLDRAASQDILTVTSDFLNGNVRGDIVPSTLAPTIKNLVATILPDVIKADTIAANDHNRFAADFTLSNAEGLCEFFKLPVQVIYPVEFTASVNGEQKLATFTLDAPYLQQGDKIIDQTVSTVMIDGEDQRATAFATLRTPTKKGPMTVVVDISGSLNRLDTRVDWQLDRKIPLNGQFNFSTLLSRSENGQLCIDNDFNPGQINFGEDLWEIGRSSLSWCENRLDVYNFSLKSSTQSINIDGSASATAADSLTIDLDHIALASIFETLEIDKALIGGRATGRFIATEVLSRQPILSTDNLHVDSIGYNYCTLGTADITAHWDNDKQSFFLDADIVNPEGQHSRIWGDIFATKESLDLNFDAKHVRVGFMKPFMEAFTSDISGYVSGKARLFGTFKDIDLTGDVFAENLRLKIDFTNTYYTANDSLHITPGLITLKDITIRDVNGKTAKLNGWLKHDYFHLPVFNFKVTEARDLLCYNVTSRLNPDWWGTIYGNGSATIEGEPGKVFIGVDMTTAQHSQFTFVLTDRLDAEQYSFITFNDITKAEDDVDNNYDDIPAIVREYQARRLAQAAEEEPSAYLMDIKVDITPEAELIIVMDPVGGDRIRAYGSGDLAMEYNSTDNFLGMRGTYTLDRGDYNFTLQDIIIKDFTIEQGSSITFKGDPYSAELDLLAVYSLNANLSDLDESFTQDRDLNRTNVPVQALLKVNGDMRQPDITFDLRFPTLTSDTYRKVRSIISTEDMMSRQIIYLLALNRFYTPDYMASTTKGNEIFSVAASTISSQISNILGKLSDNWSIAPNLRSDRGDFSDIELDVALSSRLLNNRLLLNGNFGYRDKSLNTNQFIGDFDIEYLLTPRGTWRLRGYNRYNDQNYYLRQATTTQGVGIMFKRDFDSIFGRRHKKTVVDTAPADSVATPTDTIQ